MTKSFIGWQLLSEQEPQPRGYESYYVKRVDGSLDYGWYLGKGIWVGTDQVLNDVVMWAQSN